MHICTPVLGASVENAHHLGVSCSKAVIARECVPLSLGMGAGCGASWRSCAYLSEEILAYE